MPKESPLVTVLMPVYNGEKYLSEAIESILGQTYQNIELLIINDGSKDSSKSIIQSYRDPRITYYENESNLGLIKTLNLGIELSNGIYVVRMDADDIAMIDRVEKQIRYLEENPEVLLVGGNHSIIGEDQIIRYHQNYRTIKSALFFESPAAHPCLAIRKKVFETIRYNINYPSAEDYKLLCDIAKIGAISNLDNVILRYRKHENQISSTSFNIQKSTHSKIVAELLKNEMGLNADQQVLHKFFKYDRLNINEALIIICLYVRLLLKSFLRSDLDSLFILKRIITIIKIQMRSMW